MASTIIITRSHCYFTARSLGSISWKEKADLKMKAKRVLNALKFANENELVTELDKKIEEVMYAY